MKHHWPVIILLVLGFAATRQQASLKKAQNARRSLNTELASLNRLDQAQDTTIDTQAEINGDEWEQLRQRARRVYQLRGDVTMAQQQLDKLTPVVANLTARLEARTNQLSQAATPEFPPGYIPRNELADRGNATPEAALETVWWALSHGNGQRLMELVFEMIGQKVPDIGSNPDQGLSMFRGFPGYRIVRRKSAGDKVSLGMETAPGARVVDFELVRTNGQWYFSEESFRNALQGASGN